MYFILLRLFLWADVARAKAPINVERSRRQLQLPLL